MHTITLSNKQTIPNLGYGTWRVDTAKTAELTTAAIKAGYRHIDCAKVYGNEKEVGEGIKNALGDGGVQRKDLFVTGKLWNTDHAPKDVAAACRQTLKDLGLEYLDLYLVHWNVSFVHGEEEEPLDENGVAKFSFVPLQETWRAMEKLVDEGLVKSIGVSNFTAPMLLDLLSYAKVKPVMNQIEMHPYYAQHELLKFCRSQNIAVTAYSPFGSQGAPVLKDLAVQMIALKHSRTPAQIVLGWAIQRGTIAIPKCSSEARITENAAIDFELTDKDMEALDGLDKRKSLVDPMKWWGFPYF